MNEPKLRFKADDGSQFPDWEEKTLGDIGTAKMCKRVLKEQTSEKGDVPFYKIGTFGGTPDAFISRELYEELKTKYSFPRKGNILLSAAGTIGRTVVYDGQDAFFQDSNIVWLDNDDSVLDGFLLQFYNKTSWDNLEGGTIKRLYNGLFLSKVIHVPSLPEQQKIAEFLSTIDTVIEKQKETVSAWEERKKGVMQKLFSQEVRFKADDGSEFPEWENVTVLDLLVQPITDGPHETPVLEENGVSFVSVEAIDNGRVNLTKRRGFISKEYDNVCAKKYKPRLYDVYMVKSGATTGKVAIVTITDDFNIWSPLAAMRTSSKTEAFFLYYQLQSDMIQNQVWTKLSLGNQPNLGMRALELFSAVRPCLAEQQKIVDCLSSLDEVIETQKATLSAWEELKKGLLQQMFV